MSQSDPEASKSGMKDVTRFQQQHLEDTRVEIDQFRKMDKYKYVNSKS